MPVHADVKGLVVGSSYHYRLVVRKGTTILPGDDETFATPVGPVLSGSEVKRSEREWRAVAWLG